MLLLRPRPSIFQLIVLPHLSSSRASASCTAPTSSQEAKRRVSYSRCTRKPYDQATSNTPVLDQGPALPFTYYSPAGSNPPSVDTAKRKNRNTKLDVASPPVPLASLSILREYIGYTGDKKGEPPPTHLMTAALALETIIKVHSPESAPRVKRGGLEGADANDRGSAAGKTDDLETETSWHPVASSLRSPRAASSLQPFEPGSVNTMIEPLRPSSAILQTPVLPARDLAPSSAAKSTALPVTLERFPPTVHQLLHARLHRLACYHILRTPQFASDPALIERVAAHFEKDGAGKVAKRLRRGVLETSPRRAEVDGIQSSGDEGPSTMSLGGAKSALSESKPARVKFPGKAVGSAPDRPLEPSSSERKPVDYWNLPPIAPSSPRDLPSHLTPSRRLTAFHNHQLTSLLHRPGTSYQPGFKPPSRFPSPNPSLRQLRALLIKIKHLEQHSGFRPDRVTANIILACWVRCGAGLDVAKASWHGNTTRIIKSKKEGWRVAHKKQCEVAFGKADMRMIFEVTSRLLLVSAQQLLSMSTSMSGSSEEPLAVSVPFPHAPSTSPSGHFGSTTDGTFAQKSNGQEPEYDSASNPVFATPHHPEVLDMDLHVRPYIRIINRGFKNVGDGSAWKDVAGFEKEIGDILWKFRNEGKKRNHEVLESRQMDLQALLRGLPERRGGGAAVGGRGGIF